MRFDVIRTIFLKEVREMLRDRRSLAVMFGLPLLLYPLLAIGIAKLGQSRKQELTEQAGKLVVVHPEAAPKLLGLIEQPGSGLQIISSPGDLETALDKGQVDAVLELPERAQDRALALEPVQLLVKLNRSRTIAGFVERKLDAVIADYEHWLIEQRLTARNVSTELLEPIKVERLDVATGDQRFGKILAQTLPVLLMMTGMLGALFPALNATTTERELGTLETLLVTPTSRIELLLAKGSLVLICALLTAGLNMLSMSLVLLRSVSMLDEKMASQLTISPGALFLSYLAAVPALIFFSSLVMIVGLLARNFREANSFATPTMLIPITALAIGIAEPAPSVALMLTPVASTTIIIREVLTGHFSTGAFIIAFASSCLYSTLVLSVAGRLFSSEQLVNPAWEPISLRGLRRGKGRKTFRLPAVDEAIALFIVCLLLLFYVSPSWFNRKWSLLPILLGTQLLLILAPTLLASLLGRWKWRETFSWRKADPLLMLGAAFLAIGLAPWAQFIYALQNSVWPSTPGPEQQMIVDSLTRHPLVTIVLIGLLAGVCEEMLFRGPIQSAFSRQMPVWSGLFAGALLFGLMHLDLHGLAIRTALGLLLAWVVWRGGSIFPAMLLHGLYDSFSLFMVWVANPANAETSARLTQTDIFFLGGGAVLLPLGWIMCRQAFRRQGPVDASTTSLAGFEPIVASSTAKPETR